MAKSAAAARQQQRRLLPKETVLSVTRAELTLKVIILNKIIYDFHFGFSAFFKDFHLLMR